VRRIAVFLLAALSVGACQSSSTPAGTTTTTTRPLPPSWSGAGPAPTSKLVAVDDRIVYLGGALDALELVALDAATGAVSWQQPAAAPALLPGQRPSVLADDSAVLALGTPTSLISVDAHDGAVRWRAPLPGPATGSPMRCGDDICISVGASAPAPTADPAATTTTTAPTTTFEPATPTTVAAGPSATPALVALDRDDGHVTAVGHELGAAVVAIDGSNVLSIDGPDLVLARSRATEAVWRAPLAAVLGASTTPPLQLRWRAWTGPGDAWVVYAGTDSDSALGVTAGITAKGSVAWRASGSRPCPFLDDSSARDGDESLPVLICSGLPTTSVEGIDPITGAAAWQLDDPFIERSAASVVRTSGRSWLFDVPPVRIDVDLADGPRLPGGDITGGWCGVPDPYPCTVAGAAVAAPDAVPAFAGVTGGGWGAWIDDGRVKAIKLP
jgi:hypothetical protein